MSFLCCKKSSATKADKIVTGDETWTHLFEPETKRQPKEWHDLQSPRRKTFKTTLSAGKVMITVFWDTGDMKDLFDTFDCNKDGLITKDEILMNFQSLRLPISGEDVDFMMVMYDTNGDGCLNFLELTKVIKHYMETKDFPLDEMFQFFDTDNDKHISLPEFVKAMRCLGVDMTTEQAGEILPYYYTPGTTLVDYESFVKLMKTYLG